MSSAPPLPAGWDSYESRPAAVAVKDPRLELAFFTRRLLREGYTQRQVEDILAREAANLGMGEARRKKARESVRAERPPAPVFSGWQHTTFGGGR